MNVHSSAYYMQLAVVSKPRIDEILDRIRPVFANKGFDGASMQDLARAAEMSVGNFYRYFPSKSAIVQAMIARDMASMDLDFAKIGRMNDPLLGLKEIFAERIAFHQSSQDGALWADIQAAASRNPALAQVSCQVEREVILRLRDLLVTISGRANPADLDRFSKAGALVILLFKSGSNLQPSNDPLSSHLTEELLRIMHETLSSAAETH